MTLIYRVLTQKFSHNLTTFYFYSDELIVQMKTNYPWVLGYAY